MSAEGPSCPATNWGLRPEQQRGGDLGQPEQQRVGAVVGERSGHGRANTPSLLALRTGSGRPLLRQRQRNLRRSVAGVGAAQRGRASAAVLVV